MVSLAGISLASAMLLSSYLTIKCFLPPNPNKSEDQWKTDRVQIVYHPAVLRLGCILVFSLALYHAYVTLAFFDAGSTASPPSYLTTYLFHWNPFTAICLAIIIFIGAPLRLAAYGSLGTRFTFNLAPPNELNTRGVYSYIQHPSYSGLLLAVVPHALLFARWDGAIGMLIPHAIHAMLMGYGYVVYAVGFLVTGYMLAVRIRDEEAMLKETFGKKWVAWNKSTARLIPGVL